MFVDMSCGAPLGRKEDLSNDITGRAVSFQAELRRRKEEFEARFARFLEFYTRESGITGLATFFPHEEAGNDSNTPTLDWSYTFRESEVVRCSHIWRFRAKQQAHKEGAGAEKRHLLEKKPKQKVPKMANSNGKMPALAFEGNVNYLWALPTSELEVRLASALSCDVCRWSDLKGQLSMSAKKQDQLREGILKPTMLGLYAEELAFRQMYVRHEIFMEQK